MASKRKADDSHIPLENPKRIHEIATGLLDTILQDGDNMDRSLLRTCDCTVNHSCLEAIIEKVIEKKFPSSSHHHQSPSLTPDLQGGSSGMSEAKLFKMEFSNNLKQEYYTEHKMLAERDEPIRIVLRDIGSNSVVTEGPMSSLEIEICVVRGDFSGGDHHDQDYWSSAQFNTNIIVQTREGKPGTLLKGDTRINLKHGVAIVGKIEFTDISKWDRTGNFRLAAKPKAAPKVREAVSQPFVVKDKRGVSTMKYAQPSLDSEIWRLRHIAKGKKIHTQLSAEGIKTVKDFLRLHTTNPSLLKQKCGNIPSKKWEDIVENAGAFVDDKVLYFYLATETCLGFVFNSIYEVVKVSFDGGQTYRSPETFTPAEKHSVELAKKEAYRNVHHFQSLDNNMEAELVGQSSNSGVQADIHMPAQQEWELIHKDGHQDMVNSNKDDILVDVAAKEEEFVSLDLEEQLATPQGLDDWDLLGDFGRLFQPSSVIFDNDGVGKAN